MREAWMTTMKKPRHPENIGRNLELYLYVFTLVSFSSFWSNIAIVVCRVAINEIIITGSFLNLK